jgi:preprotein translocase subunit SecG
MNVFLTLLLAVQILCALVMIGLILIQHGKGADMGAAFGSGGSGSLFGASGSANFLSRTTGVLAAVFFACTLALAYFGNARPSSGSGSVLDRAGAPATAASAPAPQSPAQQIPGAESVVTPATPAAATPATPAASGAAQIPGK